MRTSISSIALGVALGGRLLGASAANAQTVITRDISGQPVQTVIIQQPVQTVQTTETVRTIRPASKSTVRRQVVTTRRIVVNQSVVRAQTVAAPPIIDTTVAAYPQPLYDRAAPLYDTVAPVPAADNTIDNTMIGAPPPAVGTAPVYRYVYEPDRILVIDPITNIAVQALPR
jgi:hypothetical protein